LLFLQYLINNISLEIIENGPVAWDGTWWHGLMVFGANI
jgi:hypothetical protein